MRYGEIDFDALAKRYEKWWRGELGRPIIPVVIGGADPGRPMPKVPPLSFATAFDERYSPKSCLTGLTMTFHALSISARRSRW